MCGRNNVMFSWLASLNMKSSHLWYDPVTTRAVTLFIKHGQNLDYQ